ncbi:metallophosphoesterase family protein [Candidatus Nitrospira bockiana]
MLVGVISDTHGLLRPEALSALRGSDLILHAGDIGAPEVLDTLGELAPVLAVRGNNDRGPWARALPASRILPLEGLHLCLIHDLADLPQDRLDDAVRVIVSGHSHRPAVREREGRLYVNPGSAGPRRFRLPVSVARLSVERHLASAHILHLDVPAGRRTGRT